MIIYIYNNVNFHYEIIESIILQYPFIIGKKLENPIIYLSFHKNNNISFYHYITKKYPSIKIGIPSSYDYSINCSIYARTRRIIKRDKKHFYISHEYNPFLLPFKNVFFVFPKIKERYISLHYLPFQNEKINIKTPIYIIQGNLNHGFRRNFYLLKLILGKKYKYPFQIKLIGSGQLPKILHCVGKSFLLRTLSTL